MGFFDSSSWGASSTRPPTLPKCGQCGLYAKCHSPKMQVDGKGKRKVLVVGEAPGETEDKQGRPFIGESGQLLRELFDQAGADLDDCWITNAVVCRPPNNKIDDVYIESCRPHLYATIQKLKPKVIILTGMSPVQSVLPWDWNETLGAIGRWVGWAVPSPTFSAWICPTYHPSFIVRSNRDAALMLVTKNHIKKALALEGEEPPIWSEADLLKEVQIVTDIDDVAERLHVLAKKEGRLAIDYEATGLKPELPEHRIVSMSYCFEGQETVSFPVIAELHGPIRRILRNPRLLKIAANIRYEERWSRRKLGTGVAGWWWDTVLGAHVIDNRSGDDGKMINFGGICSIKFQGFIRHGIGGGRSTIKDQLEMSDRKRGANGFNRILDVNLRDLLGYGGLDSLVEYRVALEQREELGYAS